MNKALHLQFVITRLAIKTYLLYIYYTNVRRCALCGKVKETPIKELHNLVQIRNIKESKNE